MEQRNERVERIQQALRDAKLDALVCSSPTNVLLISGYWPVVGTSVAVVTREGAVALLVPEDERDLAERGWATKVHTFQPGSLTALAGPAEAIRGPLATVLRNLELQHSTVGYWSGAFYEASSYAAMYFYGSELVPILHECLPEATLKTADAVIARLRSSMVPAEVEQVRRACDVASVAFEAGKSAVLPGSGEDVIAAALHVSLINSGLERSGTARVGGFAYCMSGPHAAQAGGAYARTRARLLSRGDLVLVHCNSSINGYWTDITRTYSLGGPDERQSAMYRAIFEARDAAFSAIRPGVRGADVDRAARDVLAGYGFERYFTHGLGHNVGFSVISADFPPRLHPASEDLLEVGMTFNIEPAIYIEGYGGIRHCDVVTLHANGAEVLTPFQASLEQLIVDDNGYSE